MLFRQSSCNAKLPVFLIEPLQFDIGRHRLIFHSSGFVSRFQPFLFTDRSFNATLFLCGLISRVCASFIFKRRRVNVRKLFVGVCTLRHSINVRPERVPAVCSAYPRDIAISTGCFKVWVFCRLFQRYTFPCHALWFSHPIRPSISRAP